jgi:RNA polymerase sigma factor (TIGR02999 family)
MGESGEITLLLQRWSAGNEAALESLFEIVYPDLRRMAHGLFRQESSEHLLQPTIVVNELYLKLLQQNRLALQDRRHFFSLAARFMRRILVDYARHEGRGKRDGGVRIPLDEELAWIDPRGTDMIDLDRALDELQQLDERKCHMLELRYFLGLTAEETAEFLSVSKATVDRDLQFTLGWLYQQLHPERP